MEEKLEYSEVPYNYPLCLNEQCPKAATCLRQLAAQCTPDNITYWTIVSPKQVSIQEGDCSYYRSNAKARYASGLLTLLNNLPYKQMQVVTQSLIAHFSRRTYYRIRKGERTLSPAEQKYIQRILKDCGVTKVSDFDAYFEAYDW